MAEPPDSAADDFHSEDAILVSIWNRIIVLAFELNVQLRAASMGGNPVPVDVVQRIDPITGNEYTEVLVNGLPHQEEGDATDSL